MREEDWALDPDSPHCLNNYVTPWLCFGPLCLVPSKTDLVLADLMWAHLYYLALTDHWRLVFSSVSIPSGGSWKSKVNRMNNDSPEQFVFHVNWMMGHSHAVTLPSPQKMSRRKIPKHTVWLPANPLKVLKKSIYPRFPSGHSLKMSTPELFMMLSISERISHQNTV